MGKNKLIIVWMNRKKKRLHRNKRYGNQQSLNRLHKEGTAATIEDSDDDSQLPSLVRKHGQDVHRESFLKRKTRFSTFKPILIAVFSAIIIGSGLGLFMLNMFVEIGHGLNETTGNLPAITDDADANEGDSSAKGTMVTVEPINAFVLQAGVFSGKANADEMAATFKASGFSTMIWKKGNQYFLLAGIAESKQQAEQLASNFGEHKLEVYVKKWHTDSKKVQLSNAEADWIQLYKEQWNKSIASLSSKSHVSKSGWTNVVNSIPEQKDTISEFASFVKSKVTTMKYVNIWDESTKMLSFWYQFHLMTMG